MSKPLIAVATIALALGAGCSTVNVLKDPGPNSTGIRFYRPKPYLFVTPADATGRMVKLKLEYLPDYNEEYQIKVKGKKTKVALKDGWNLVGVNSDGPPPEPPAPAEAPIVGPASGDALPPVVVAASNVPVGFYESVLEPVNGKKVFRGWRYIGFSVLGGGSAPGDPNLPICGASPCPHSPGHPCRNPEFPQPVFGLVSVNGVMNFREIGEIASNNGCPFFVETPTPEAAVAPLPPVVPPGEIKPIGESDGRMQPIPPDAVDEDETLPAPMPQPPAPPTVNPVLDLSDDALPPLPPQFNDAPLPTPAAPHVSSAPSRHDAGLTRASHEGQASKAGYDALYDARHRGGF